jgi:hypothetical protein
VNIEKIFIFNKIEQIYHNNIFGFFLLLFLVLIGLVFIGPIISLICFLIKSIFKIFYHIFLFNWNFIFNNFKKKKKSQEKPQISINNQIPYQYDEKNLTLIEMKILEIAQRERENKNSQHNLLKLELNQHKIENKIELNEQKNYFEKKILEQQIKFLEKEIEKIKQKKDDDNINHQKQKNNSKKQNINKKNEIEKNLSFIDEAIKKQIPENLKKIFEEIENLKNTQFFILENMIQNHNSYYDKNQNILYINPKDLFFIKKLLIDKSKEQKKLN